MTPMIQHLLLQVQFNSALQRKDISKTHHKADKETPLSIYVALLIHAETRSKLLIKKLHEHGLCISYYRMFSLSTSIGNSICAQLKKDGIVSPNFMCQGVVTTHAVDNIDHDSSSRSARYSFHGTATSSTQHLNLIL